MSALRGRKTPVPHDLGPESKKIACIPDPAAPQLVGLILGLWYFGFELPFGCWSNITNPINKFECRRRLIHLPSRIELSPSTKFCIFFFYSYNRTFCGNPLLSLQVMYDEMVYRRLAKIRDATKSTVQIYESKSTVRCGCISIQSMHPHTYHANTCAYATLHEHGMKDWRRTGRSPFCGYLWFLKYSWRAIENNKNDQSLFCINRRRRVGTTSIRSIVLLVNVYSVQD